MRQHRKQNAPIPACFVFSGSVSVVPRKIKKNNKISLKAVGKSKNEKENCLKEIQPELSLYIVSTVKETLQGSNFVLCFIRE